MAALEELQLELLVVNTAISRMIKGEVLTEFEIGSGASARRYQYGEVTLETLNTEKTRILSEIAVLSNTEPTYRKSSVMNTIYRKI